MPANDHHEITSDGVTVWVNDNMGTCIGRFGKLGFEVHRDTEGQLSGGSQCLACNERTDDFEADWATFKADMLRFYGVAVGDAVKPRNTRTAG